MASLARDGKGWRVLFTSPDGKRQTLRLGRTDRKGAESIRTHVESLLAAKAAGLPIPQATAVWVAGIGDVLRDKLARAGLIDARPTATLGDAIADYLKRQMHLKPASRCVTEQALRSLLAFFSPTRRLDSITPGDADDFSRWLQTGGRSRKRMEQSPALRPATVARRLGRVRSFFRDAQRRKWIHENPFAEVRIPAVSDQSRDAYVPTEVVERLIEAAPEIEFKLLLAMARYLGVRVPSEPFSMTWDCVDWEHRLLRVPSPKTAAQGKAYRMTPIFPPVLPHLEAAFDAAEPGQVFIFHRLRQRESVKAAERGWWANVNLRQRLMRLITRIGEQPWPRLWHALRASAETDLVARFPIHVVTAWLGNTPRIALKHYLRVTADDNARAAEEPWKSGAKSGAPVAQNPAQQVPAAKSTESLIEPESLVGCGFMRQDAKRKPLLHKDLATPTGFEPVLQA